MTPEEAFLAMNQLGKEQKPFLFVFDYDLKEAIIVENPQNNQEILYKLPLGNNHCSPFSLPNSDFIFTPFPISYEEYLRKFQIVQQGLQRGDSFLLNLTVATPIETSLNLAEIYSLAQAPYKILVKNRFVCFSPESFVRIDCSLGKIETRPMKGTIDASLPLAEKKILENPKERAEHFTIVDLMRSDLARVASNIEVKQFRYIDKVKTLKGKLLQVSSLIEGTILKGKEFLLGDIFRELLPAGSISGAPKPATKDLIHKAEGESRGFYTGIFGLFDGTKVDSAVLIRFIAQKGNKKIYHSGGGITINSSPKEEYQEVLEKVYIPMK